MNRGALPVFVLILASACLAYPQTKSDAKANPEQRAARALNRAVTNPLDLRAFLVNMPKGGDLHIHLVGAVYAESWIRAAAQDHMCVELSSLSLVPNSAGSPDSQAECKPGDIPADRAYADQHLYDALVDAFSMRGFVPLAGVTAHDHFFDSFSKFILVDPHHTGEWLDEIAARAAAQNEQYLELMVTPPFHHTAAIAKQIGWGPNRSFAGFRQQLFEHGLRDDLAVVHDYIDQAETIRRRIEHCGEPRPAAACAVTLRYIYQVLRAFPPQQVFAQTLLGFEAASADPRIVGINYVQPEDARIAMSDYALQMKMLDYFHTVYPKVHVSLHAGELAPGMVPPEGLCCHIRLAIEQGHAERIGHGVDVMYEDRPYDLLERMAGQHVMVEINLTSNDIILGIVGNQDPLPIYRRFGVPVALSTDDEGVSRIDLTHEYVRAVETYGLIYSDLKQMVRTSIEHSFLPGASLWRQQDVFTHTAKACAQDRLGTANPSPECADFLQSSEKAQQQWELERRFAQFESQQDLGSRQNRYPGFSSQR